MYQRRVVITGLGVLAPNGSGKETFWQACMQGRSGIRTINFFDTSDLTTRFAGNVADFAPEEFGLTEDECVYLDRGSQFASAAASLALDDAGLKIEALSVAERESTGVYMGTAIPALMMEERLWLQLTDNGAHSRLYRSQEIGPITPLLSYSPSGVIATRYHLGGPCLTIATGCSAGADAVGQAFWQIQEGRADRILAGGTDAALSRLGVSVFSVMHALSTRNDEPERASRPYDIDRDGFVFAEGAAVLLLEERELALARGAHIYAEIVTFTTNSSTYHMAALPKEGEPLQALLRMTMQRVPHDCVLGYINSHGSSTPTNDVAETFAYKRVFGSQAYQIPISSTKSLIGHTQGAASAIEALVTALALDRQILPPTINQDNRDPECDLDYIPNEARAVDPRQPLRFALTHSSGFGGINTALIMARDGIWNDVRAITPKRVVVTGLGAVTPYGIGTTTFWQGLCAGRSVMGPFVTDYETDFPLPYVGQIKDFRSEDYLHRKVAMHTDRMTHLTFAAVQEAIQDAELLLAQEDPQRIGAVVANVCGGVGFATEQLEKLYQRGPRFVSVQTALAWLHVANIGRVSIQYGLQGYGKVPVNDRCGGLDALGLAYRAIRRGEADVLVAGGTEAALHSIGLYVFGTLPAFSTEASASAYRPFDRRANGLLIAEGAGVCILEEYEHAMKRGARIYGEIVGYAQTNAPVDPITHALSGPTAYMRALQLALAEAHMTPEDIACLFPDGCALPAWDASETMALHEVLGSVWETLPCSVPRTQYGHSLAAAGALDTISALLSLRERRLPPTLNCEQPNLSYAPPGLVHVGSEGSSVLHSRQAALVCARGLNGSHVVLALKRDVE